MAVIGRLLAGAESRKGRHLYNFLRAQYKESESPAARGRRRRHYGRGKSVAGATKNAARACGRRRQWGSANLVGQKEEARSAGVSSKPGAGRSEYGALAPRA